MDGFLDLSKFEFNKQSRLGKGSFGEVYKIIEKETGTILAAKISLNPIIEDNEFLITNLRRELTIISQLNHPSILRFIGYSPINFQNDPNPVIITEYSANGSLERIIDQERKSLSPPMWDDTKKLINIYGIASAISYLHSHEIIHRDLKPANILEDEYLFPKVADFGLSKTMHSNSESMTTESAAGFKGTPIYTPPEVWEKNEYTKAGDVYAFAMIVYELMTLEEPFKDYNITMLCNKVVINGERPEFKYKIADCYRELITKCWSQNPSERPTFDEIVDMLKNNDNFIIDSVDKQEFLDYIDLIESQGCSFDKYKKFQKIVLQQPKVNEIDENTSDCFSYLCRIDGFDELSKENQEIVKKAFNCNHEDIKSIDFKVDKTIILVANKSLNLPSFISFLKHFDIVSFEVEAQSNFCQPIFTDLCKIKQTELKNIEIKLIASDLSKCLFLKDQHEFFTVNIPSSVTLIGKKAFYYCKLLTKVTIPSSVTSIDEYAFSECSSLSEVLFQLPSSLVSIGLCSFSYCTSLSQIFLPPSLNVIGSLSFESCSSLKQISIPNSSASILAGAFSGCYSLSQISLPPTLSSIGSNTFCACLSLAQITIPSSVTLIKSVAFTNCSSLTQVTIPSSVTSIGDSAFAECTSLAQITFEKNSQLKCISFRAFLGCKSLKEIVIPNSVTSIHYLSFSKCISLAKISFESPSMLKIIGDQAFSDCTSLTEIIIPNSVTYIGKSSFSNCALMTKIKIPSSFNKLFLRKFLGISKNVQVEKY